MHDLLSSLEQHAHDHGTSDKTTYWVSATARRPSRARIAPLPLRAERLWERSNARAVAVPWMHRARALSAQREQRSQPHAAAPYARGEPRRPPRRAERQRPHLSLARPRVPPQVSAFANTLDLEHAATTVRETARFQAMDFSEGLVTVVDRDAIALTRARTPHRATRLAPAPLGLGPSLAQAPAARSGRAPLAAFRGPGARRASAWAARGAGLTPVRARHASRRPRPFFCAPANHATRLDPWQASASRCTSRS